MRFSSGTWLLLNSSKVKVAESTGSEMLPIRETGGNQAKAQKSQEANIDNGPPKSQKSKISTLAVCLDPHLTLPAHRSPHRSW